MRDLSYRIQDWFQHDKFGVIISIANPELDRLSNNKIKNLVGDRVAILDSTSDEKKWAKVSEIEIANSIIDKKNIHICLGSSIKLSDIKPNSDIIFIPKQENIEAKQNTLI